MAEQGAPGDATLRAPEHNRSFDKPNMTEVPSFVQLMVPLFTALGELGGSASIAEIDEKVGELLGLPEETLERPHNPEKSNQTEFQYRLAWARTYLKQYGLIDNSQRGVWVIAPDKRGVTEFDPQEVVREVREQHRRNREERVAKDHNGATEIEAPDETEAWRQTLHRVLTEIVDPAAFERLIQRLLRESGFIHVEVTGRSGDGGIDGKGIARMSGLLSFHVIFQCKRYAGAVSASHVRDFRGAMVGHADKGLLITTGTFTRDAIREATRDGAPPLDLIDGDQLADMLKNLGLGAWSLGPEKGRNDLPEISRFLGIIIAMYYNDHNPPHFHAKYGDYEAVIAIDSGEVVEAARIGVGSGVA